MVVHVVVHGALPWQGSCGGWCLLLHGSVERLVVLRCGMVVEDNNVKGDTSIGRKGH